MWALLAVVGIVSVIHGFVTAHQLREIAARRRQAQTVEDGHTS